MLERQQIIQQLLGGLRGLRSQRSEQLFWSELNYDRINTPLSRRRWGADSSHLLADDPLLLASGGEEV